MSQSRRSPQLQYKMTGLLCTNGNGFSNRQQGIVGIEIYGAFYQWKCKIKGPISFHCITMLSACRPVSIA